MGLRTAVGGSRLLLAVHFTSDVIAGFASGAVWLVLGVTSIELIRGYHPRTA